MRVISLDYRAATYEKLKQYKPALQDGKDMIELKPQAAKVTPQGNKKHFSQGMKDLKNRLGIPSLWEDLANFGEKGRCIRDLRERPQ